MNLEARASDRGFAMAALLVGMSVMAIMLSVAMPTWNQQIRRDKEEELIFRGNQYARAINFYQRRFANASPPSLDVLIDQHMLRKKYKDPMSTEKNGEFQLLYLSMTATPGRAGGANQQSGNQQSQSSAGMVLGTTPTGGILGVASKNKGESLRVYNGKTHYNEWQFVALQQSAQGGGGARGGPAGLPPGSSGPDGSFGGRDGRGNQMNLPPGSFDPSRGGRQGQSGQGQRQGQPPPPSRGFSSPPR
jgi:type II secretory pathway pseudopilin PulG